MSGISDDRRIPRETQLRVFLTRAYFGAEGEGEIPGFPAAAKAFFAKSPDELSDSEYFRLLATLDGPNAYHVLRQPKANAGRVARIQQQMPEACGEGCFQGDSPIPCGAEGVQY